LSFGIKKEVIKITGEHIKETREDLKFRRFYYKDLALHNGKTVLEKLEYLIRYFLSFF